MEPSHRPAPEDAAYAKRGVEWYWIVDPDALTLDAYALEGDGYSLDTRLEGTEPRALRPFFDMTLDPASIWRP